MTEDTLKLYVIDEVDQVKVLTEEGKDEYDMQRAFAAFVKRKMEGKPRYTTNI